MRVEVVVEVEVPIGVRDRPKKKTRKRKSGRVNKRATTTLRAMIEGKRVIPVGKMQILVERVLSIRPRVTVKITVKRNQSVKIVATSAAAEKENDARTKGAPITTQVIQSLRRNVRQNVLTMRKERRKNAVAAARILLKNGPPGVITMEKEREKTTVEVALILPKSARPNLEGNILRAEVPVPSLPRHCVIAPALAAPLPRTGHHHPRLPLPEAEAEVEARSVDVHLSRNTSEAVSGSARALSRAVQVEATHLLLHALLLLQLDMRNRRQGTRNATEMSGVRVLRPSAAATEITADLGAGVASTLEVALRRMDIGDALLLLLLIVSVGMSVHTLALLLLHTGVGVGMRAPGHILLHMDVSVGTRVHPLAPRRDGALFLRRRECADAVTTCALAHRRRHRVGASASVTASVAAAATTTTMAILTIDAIDVMIEIGGE